MIETNVGYLRSIRNELPQNYLRENNLDVLLDNKDIDENSNSAMLTYELNEEHLDSLLGTQNRRPPY